MSRYGSFALTIGHPIQLQGFRMGATISWSQDKASASWAGLKVNASLSAPYRLDLDQDEGEILASYVDRFTNHPLGLNFVSQAGIAVNWKQNSQVPLVNDRIGRTIGSEET